MSERKEYFRGTLVHRYCLTKPGSSKQTWHVEIDIADSGFQFRPGDSLGVIPKNSQHTVKTLLHYFHLDPDSTFFDQKLGLTLPVGKWLQGHVEINRVSERLAKQIESCAFSMTDRKLLADCIRDKSYEGHDVLSFLLSFAPAGVHLNDIAQTFPPIRPRLYSIASGSSLKSHRIDLTVARVRFEMNGKSCHGLCSHYLTQEAHLGIPEIQVFLQPTKHFVFPEDKNLPVIMIGPGTGVAPFRAYLQEIEAGAITKPPCWLFFGERRRSTDFLYEDFWSKHVAAGHLRLDLAFSRDQEEKVYVHHRMWEHRIELWRWVMDGAKIYVCGDAKQMAKDVDRCLVNIICDQAHIDESESVQYIRKLRSDGRYLRDIY